MPKRVHFAPTNTVFSPSREPSPALSLTSLPSDDSSELSTPPPEVDHDSAATVLYPRSSPPDSLVHYTPHPRIHDLIPIPKPSPEPVHMNIHFLLAYYPDTDIPLLFDLSTGQIGSYIDVPDLAAPATEPHLPSLIISCPHLAWDIPVGPPATEHRSYVTVHDVLRCLHRGLRLAVTQEEYDALAIGPTKEAVDAAYHARCSRIEDPQKRVRDEKWGVRRIDFLLGMNLFKGLSGTMSGPHLWELNVARHPLLPVVAPTPPFMATVAASAI